MRRRTLESVLLHTQHRGRGSKERKGGRVQDVSHLRILCAGQCGEPQPAVAKSGNLVSACLSLVRSLGVDRRPAFRELLGLDARHLLREEGAEVAICTFLQGALDRAHAGGDLLRQLVKSLAVGWLSCARSWKSWPVKSRLPDTLLCREARIAENVSA